MPTESTNPDTVKRNKVKRNHLQVSKKLKITRKEISAVIHIDKKKRNK